MNFADSEIINRILKSGGYNISDSINSSDVILLNTCSVRDHAESKVMQRLNELKRQKERNPSLVIGVVGCMAERMKYNLIEEKKLVDLVIGPDEYRKIPFLIDNLISTGEKGIAVRLSRVETYDDIEPLRTNGLSAWISVMRGCDKFCSFCIVPFTRGRERCRELKSIVNEIKNLAENGCREVTLLGQNVNSYRSGEFDFADLLKFCAEAAHDMRIRFTTSHPQDFSLKLIEIIASYKNICKYIHLPLQSGSNRILSLMKRNYTVEHYLEKINTARTLIPDVTFSTDFISGFPSESKEDHKMTLDAMKEIEFDGAYMFKYSPREQTQAYKLDDDVPDEIKTRRLMKIIELQREISYKRNLELVGKNFDVLIESLSKKSHEMLAGRTDGNKSVIIPRNGTEIGEIVNVKILKVNSSTLFGEITG